jgi:hypothetical protein
MLNGVDEIFINEGMMLKLSKVDEMYENKC